MNRIAYLQVYYYWFTQVYNLDAVIIARYSLANKKDCTYTKRTLKYDINLHFIKL
jgi:hypothetical protein